MSVSIRCGEAARLLLREPELIDPDEYGGIRGLFTELDVIVLASKLDGGWGRTERDRAQRECSNVLGGLYRARKVVRYGPVELPGISEPDYLRMGSKIVYAAPDGPATVPTPNGTFSRLRVEDDTLGRQGRRASTTRNDFEPWACQEDLRGLLSLALVQTGTDQQEIVRLRAENEALHRALEISLIDNTRLRRRRAVNLSQDQIREMVSRAVASAQCGQAA